MGWIDSCKSWGPFQGISQRTYIKGPWTKTMMWGMITEVESSRLEGSGVGKIGEL